MPDYRLYFLDPHSGHINKAEEMFAADDVAAVNAVQQRGLVVPTELWCGGRKVSLRGAPPDTAARAQRGPVVAPD